MRYLILNYITFIKKVKLFLAKRSVLHGGQRKKTISDARKITFYVIRKVTNMSYEDIGAEFKKHHSTVMYNIDQIEKDIETDTKLARQINDIISNAKSIQ